MQARFSPGAVANARLLGVAAPVPGTSSITNGTLLASPAQTPAFFSSAAAAVAAVLAVSSNSMELQAADVTGLAWQNGAPADAAAVSAQLQGAVACPAATAEACRAACSPMACMLRLLQVQTLAHNAMILRLDIRVDRNSDVGVAWADRARAALLTANAADGAATWYLLVDPTVDSVRYIYDNFGMLVGITVAVIFAILAVSFRSMAIPLRALLSIAVMEVAVFGAASGIYCDGACRCCSSLPPS